jgi:arginyl-tRNA synthetase
LDDTGKKFQSRKGDTIKLKDLLDKSLVVAGNVYDKVRKDDNGIGEDERKLIIKNVAYGSIKYADLASMRTTTYKFSLEKMVSLKGNTGVYNLYEYVRICAIVRKAGDFINDLDPRGVSIEDKEEANVCKQILLFPEIIERAYSTLMFHIVCAYMYDLTTAFSSFYKKYKCLVFDSEKNVIGINNNKMLICVSTKKILETCFFVLGINTLDRM